MTTQTAPAFREKIRPLPCEVSHELNNLLMAVSGNVALLLSQLAESDPTRRTLLAISKAADQAMDLVRPPCRNAPTTTGRRRRCDCRESLRDTLTLLHPLLDGSIEVALYTQDGLWETAGDAGKIGQVLMNLCLNARDAMPQGGVLTLTAENVHLEPPHFCPHGDTRPSDFVRLRVADSGRGISAEQLPHIYDPFFTTKQRGAGIGLAVVHDIVSQHGGWIECASEPEHGTRFDIYLPRACG